MKSSHYKLGDLFKVIKIAQCQIKLLKGDERWTFAERQIMEFNIDLLFPSNPIDGYRRRRQRGGLTQKQFRNLQSIFSCLLPGITKNNLQAIMREVREKRWKDISRRRQSKKTWDSPSESLLHIKDETYKTQLITLDRMAFPGSHHRNCMTGNKRKRDRYDLSVIWLQYKYKIENKYDKVGQSYFNTRRLYLPRHIIRNTNVLCHLELYRYRNEDGRSGLMFEINGYTGKPNSMIVPIWKLRDYDKRNMNTLSDETTPVNSNTIRMSKEILDQMNLLGEGEK